MRTKAFADESMTSGSTGSLVNFVVDDVESMASVDNGVEGVASDDYIKQLDLALHHLREVSNFVESLKLQAQCFQDV